MAGTTVTPFWRRRRSVAAALVAALLAASGLALVAWRQRPPQEVRSLEAILQRLSRGNDLGTQPFAFMVGSGSYTAQLAQQRGLCQPERCDVFAQLDPYRRYGNGWDELIRQGYAIGDIEAWSASSGTVVISRAAFRAYGPRQGYLACTVAHEIAHIRRHHIFEHSRFLSSRGRDLPDQQRELASMQRSRQHELEADRDAATMLARAGYRGRICQDELAFMYRSIGDGSDTEPTSTHPGYSERLAALRAHYDRLLSTPPKPQPSTGLRFRYDRGGNLLTVTPQPR